MDLSESANFTGFCRLSAGNFVYKMLCTMVKISNPQGVVEDETISNVNFDGFDVASNNKLC